MSEPALAILYIDDDPDIRAIVALSLRLDPGIDLRVAASGRQALDLLAVDPWRPDVLLLDVMMPDMTGPDTLAALRRVTGLADVPAFFMTARGRPMEVAEYALFGAAGTILKPFDPLALAGQVRALAGAARHDVVD